MEISLRSGFFSGSLDGFVQEDKPAMAKGGSAVFLRNTCINGASYTGNALDFP